MAVYDRPFVEFVVAIKTMSKSTSPVVLSIWAEDLEAALDCGEVLSAIYLLDRPSD